MVKAAINIECAGKVYKKGTVLPETIVTEFEENSPYLLDNYIEVNGKWLKITDKKIKGYVDANKTRIQRLIDYYGVKLKKAITGEDNSHMLRARPKVVDKDKVIIEDKKDEKGKLTKTDIKDLDKDQQIKILKDLGVKEIPKLEKDRIKEILKLQGD